MRRIKNKILSVVALTIFLTSCNDQECYLKIPNDLRKISSAEVIDRARFRNFPNLDEIQYINECGEVIARDSLVKTVNLDDFAFDDYVDEDGIVRLTLYRPATSEDKIVQEKANLAYEEGPNISPSPIKCDSVSIILDEVLVRDQNNRKSYEEYSGKNDFLNLEIVLGIIEHCNLNNLAEMSREDYQTIWLVIQHASFNGPLQN